MMNIQDKLMERFILKDYLDHNRWIALQPKKQAIMDYMQSPVIQQRVNGVVGVVLEVLALQEDK